MKQFTEKELLELKYEVAHRMSDCKITYENMVFIYFNALEVLLYFEQLGEDKVSQVDLQFWVHAAEYTQKNLLMFEDIMVRVYRELVEALPKLNGRLKILKADDELNSARRYSPRKRREMLAERCTLSVKAREAKKLGLILRKLAGIYLDIYGNKVEERSYKMWRYFYNKLSRYLRRPKRGYDPFDPYRMQLEELKLILQEVTSGVYGKTGAYELSVAERLRSAIENYPKD